ncbi:MAG: tetratricopeptide repeat protein, partial [Bacteroidales bacterium]|nr:tetratricopeptide repeat protein [Bacteroidales bacterium]
MRTEAFKSIILGILLFLTPRLYSQPNEEMRSLIHHYGTRGWYNVQYNINLDSAEYYLLKAIELQYAYYDTIDDRVATNHVSLASVYRQFYNNSAALDHLNKAEKILIEYEPNSLYLGNTYHNKGNIYRSNNDLFRTKEYYEYSLDFLEKHGYQNTTNYAHVFSSYIKLLIELEYYDQAEEQLSLIDFQSLNLNSTTEFRFHIIKASTYSQIEKYDLAVFHFEEAKKILDRESENSSNRDIVTYYYHIIDFNILYGDYSSALDHSSNAFEFIESLDPSSTKNKTIYQSNIIYRTAEIQYRIGIFDRALDLVIRGIDRLNLFFKDLSFTSSKITVRNEYSSILPELYILKSKVLFSMYQSTNSLDNLISSFGSYQKAIEIINSLKLSMQNEDSKYFATSKIFEVYNEAIYVGRLLYTITNELQYLEQAFEFAESSKSFALYSEIKNVEAMEFSGLPPDVKENEERLIGKIQGYEEMLYDEQITSNPDSNQISHYKEQLFHLKDDYDDLMKEIELDYSKYYEFKYNPKFVSLKDVQNELPYRDALIEYVLTDTML